MQMHKIMIEEKIPRDSWLKGMEERRGKDLNG